jgi:hypothetical protein
LLPRGSSALLHWLIVVIAPSGRFFTLFTARAEFLAGPTATSTGERIPGGSVHLLRNKPAPLLIDLD